LEPPVQRIDQVRAHSTAIDVIGKTAAKRRQNGERAVYRPDWWVPERGCLARLLAMEAYPQGSDVFVRERCG